MADLEKEMFLKNLSPYEGDSFELNLGGYFSADELKDFFSKMDGTSKVLVQIKKVSE